MPRRKKNSFAGAAVGSIVGGTIMGPIGFCIGGAIGAAILSEDKTTPPTTADERRTNPTPPLIPTTITPAYATFATTSRGAWLILLLQRSRLPLSDVRRVTLRESLREAPNDDALKDVLFEALIEAPFVSRGRKEAIGTVIAMERWSDLPAALDSFWGREEGGGERWSGGGGGRLCDPLDDFRSMALLLIVTSRRLSHCCSLERRMTLGSAALTTMRSKADIRGLLVEAGWFNDAAAEDEDEEECLLSSSSFSNRRQYRTNFVVDDIFDGRYYRLLRPNRFDCSEHKRRRSSSLEMLSSSTLDNNNTTSDDDDETTDSNYENEERGVATTTTTTGPPWESSTTTSTTPLAALHHSIIAVNDTEDRKECIICLGSLATRRTEKLCCGHVFCKDCIVSWALTQGNSFPCPICRADSWIDVDTATIIQS